jgi:hypothetical protein
MERFEESEQLFRAALPTGTAAMSVAVLPPALPPSVLPLAMLPSDQALVSSAAPHQEDAGKKLEQIKQFVEELFALDEDVLTPLDALNLVHRWKELLGGKAVPRLATKGRRNTRDAAPSLFD